MIDVGPFRLVNPPAGQEEIIRAAYEVIDFPWERFAVALARDADKAIIVEWDDTGQGVSGLAYGYSLKIVLSTRLYHLDSGAAFVFAHEVGHLVDSATLRDEDRDAIMALTHSDSLTYREDSRGETFNDTWWPQAHANEHDERWVSSNDYQLRHNEAFADLFVQAFAPTIWDGTEFDTGSRYVRFVHTTTDLEKFRDLVLWQPPAPAKPEPEPREKTLSRDPNIDQALRDLNQWLRHNRRRNKKRFKVLAARKILRSIRPR